MKEELEAAYKSLDKAENQVKSLRKERKQLQMTIQLLEVGGFITEGKLDEAREFIQTFKS